MFGLLFFGTKNFCLLFFFFLVALCAEIQAANITLTEVNKSVLNFLHKYEELRASVLIRKCFPRGYEDNAVMLLQNLTTDYCVSQRRFHNAVEIDNLGIF